MKTIQSTESSPLHEYSECFEIKDNKVFYKKDLLSAKNYDAARFLLAEFVRKKHGERANDSMHSDMSETKTPSPSSEVLERRRRRYSVPVSAHAELIVAVAQSA